MKPEMSAGGIPDGGAGRVEQGVRDTAGGVAATATDAVDAVKETAAVTADAFNETVATVKDAAKDTVASMKGFFDLRRNPWLLVGGALLGLILLSLLRPNRR